MGLTRSRLYKRRVSGGKMPVHRKKKAYELGRLAAQTRLLPDRRVRKLRVRGGNIKMRALRLNEGTFAWGTETISRKCKILDVVYNATSNELVRTKTLVKGAVVVIDPAPFRDWYQKYYNVVLGKETAEENSLSKSRQNLIAKRRRRRRLEKAIETQFKSGRLLACISSRPGQIGRADGRILEGAELAFYQKKMDRKAKKAK